MYSFRKELSAQLAELRGTTPTPEKFTRAEFLSGANFEFHPSSHQFLFCWCHDTVSRTLWLFQKDKWNTFQNVTSENLAKHLLDTVHELDPLINREQAKGCGVVMETLFAIKEQR